MARGDFNGDGFDDLAIGVPGEDNGAGAVNVLYSGLIETREIRLTDVGNQRWDQDTGTVESIAEAGDQFGAALAAGDFNADGFDDLAIGVPGENNGAGAVNVLFGSKTGLTDTDNARLDLDRISDLPGESQAGDQFGTALAAGDFNGDGFDELAIGAPGRDDGNIVDAGEAYVLEKTADDFTPAGTGLRLSQDILDGAPDAGDRFGSALAAGNFDGDRVDFSGGEIVSFGGRIDDLAIGVPGEQGGRGAVNVVYGTPTGLFEADDQIWDQDTGTVVGTAEAGDRFGSALAAGNFNGDVAEPEAGEALIDDLAIGVPGEDENAGAVNVVYGSPTGLTDVSNQPGISENNQRWDQDTGTIVGTAEAGDRFGSALAAGFFGPAVGLAEGLAVGVPGEDENTGAVNVIFGDLSGLNDGRNQRWDQDTGTVAGTAEAGDQFGAALAAGNFIGESGEIDQLAIGVPGEDNGAGAVNVLYSGLTEEVGLTDAGNQRWDQDTGTVLGTAEADDRFGSALTGDPLVLI